MVGFVAENAERCRTEQEMLSFHGRQPDPSRAQDAPKLAMRKESDISRQRSEPDDEPVGPAADLSGCFATRAAIPEKIPIRSFPGNILRAPALVIAIIPLGQVGLDFGLLN
jgi:hypothetical protein